MQLMVSLYKKYFFYFHNIFSQRLPYLLESVREFGGEVFSTLGDMTLPSSEFFSCVHAESFYVKSSRTLHPMSQIFLILVSQLGTPEIGVIPKFQLLTPFSSCNMTLFVLHYFSRWRPSWISSFSNISSFIHAMKLEFGIYMYCNIVNPNIALESPELTYFPKYKYL